jgi:hypothetical protein
MDNQFLDAEHSNFNDSLIMMQRQEKGRMKTRHEK